jgi:hypothetical protein
VTVWHLTHVIVMMVTLAPIVQIGHAQGKSFPSYLHFLESQIRIQMYARDMVHAQNLRLVPAQQVTLIPLAVRTDVTTCYITIHLCAMEVEPVLRTTLAHALVATLELGVTRSNATTLTKTLLMFVPVEVPVLLPILVPAPTAVQVHFVTLTSVRRDQFCYNHRQPLNSDTTTWTMKLRLESQ